MNRKEIIKGIRRIGERELEKSRKQYDATLIKLHEFHKKENTKMATCRFCGAPIEFIETPAKKVMPCNADQVFYRENSRGASKIITKNGDTVRADILPSYQGAAGLGYIPHWATCPGAKSFRKN